MALIEVIPQAAEDQGGMPVTIFYLQEGMDGPVAWYIEEDGTIHGAPLTSMRLDWRFDPRKKVWVDVSPAALADGAAGQQDDDGDD